MRITDRSLYVFITLAVLLVPVLSSTACSTRPAEPPDDTITAVEKADSTPAPISPEETDNMEKPVSTEQPLPGPKKTFGITSPLPQETAEEPEPTPTQEQKPESDNETEPVIIDTRELEAWSGKIISEEITVVGKRITCKGDLIIRKGGSLTLDDVTLTMDYSATEHYGIYVESGGELRIINKSTVTSADNTGGFYEFWYKEGSRGEITDSTIEYTWTPDTGGNSQFNEAGMFIEADGFIISNSTINNSRGNGVEAYQANGFTAENTSFSHNGANGLLIRNSQRITITGCELSHNGQDTQRTDGCGIIVLVVDGTITGNTIEYNRYTGMEGSGDMQLTVSNNKACNNGDFGMFFHDEFSTSTVDVYGNTCEYNGFERGHPGISIENAVRAYVHDNIISNNHLGIRVLSNPLTSRFTGNVISNNISCGIHVDNADTVFFRNTVKGNEWAVFVQDNHGVPAPNFGDINVSESGFNDFSGNDIGIHNMSRAVIKAENNFWGCITEQEIVNYNLVVEDCGTIDSDPWLESIS